MKRIVIAICFIVASLTISILALFAVNDGCDDMVNLLTELTNAAKTENAETVNDIAVNVDDEWKNKKILFHILIDHNEMDGIETGIEKIVRYSEEKEYSLVFTVAEDCLAEFNHIKESAEPSISNIF